MDESTISSGAGGAALSVAAGAMGAGALGFGISIAENDIGSQGNDNIVKAFIDHSQVNTSTGTPGTGTITITAESTATIKSFSLGAAVSIAISDPSSGIAGAASGGAATATDDIYNDIEAYIQNDSQVTAGGTVMITATDDASINTVGVGAAVAVSVGTVSISGAVAVSIAANTIADTVKAFIGEEGQTSDKTKVTSPGNVQINAGSIGTITDVAVAASVAGSISFGAALSGAGATATDNTGSTIAAFIDGGATVDATGSVVVQATDSASVTSNVGSGALSFGLIGASAGVSLLNDEIGDQVKAFIGDATVMSTTGDVDVFSTTTATINALGVATAVSISLGGAGAGVQTTATDNVVTQADLAKGADVTANAGGLEVEAKSTPNISAQSDGGTGGILAIGVTETLADLQGATKADIGEGVTVNVGSAGVTVSATESNPSGPNANAADATTTLVSIGAGGLSDMNARADFGSYPVNPNDIVEMDSNDTAGGTVGHWYQYLGTSPTSLVLVDTNFSNTTDWKDLGLHGSSLPTDTTNQGGATSTFVNPGDIVEMDSNNTSGGIIGDWYKYVGSAGTLDLTTTDFTNASLWIDLGAGGASLPNAKTAAAAGDVVEAFLGPETGTMASNDLTTLTSGGAVMVTSLSTTTANANASGGGGGGINVGVAYSTTGVDGTTESYAGGNLTVNAASVALGATSTNTATASTLVISIAAIGGAGANITAEDGRNTDAFIESGATIVVEGARVTGPGRH